MPGLLSRLWPVLQIDPRLSSFGVKGYGGYDAHSPLVLRDISLSTDPGQKVALVGKTGSGKSTLAKLLLGLYTPTQGEILYDGISALPRSTTKSCRCPWDMRHA